MWRRAGLVVWLALAAGVLAAPNIEWISVHFVVDTGGTVVIVGGTGLGAASNPPTVQLVAPPGSGATGGTPTTAVTKDNNQLQIGIPAKPEHAPMDGWEIKITHGGAHDDFYVAYRTEAELQLACGELDNGWEFWSGSGYCYRVADSRDASDWPGVNENKAHEKRNRGDVRQICKRFGGDLASIHNSAEDDHVKDVIHADMNWVTSLDPTDQPIWIGASKQGGEWFGYFDPSWEFLTYTGLGNPAGDTSKGGVGYTTNSGTDAQGRTNLAWFMRDEEYAFWENSSKRAAGAICKRNPADADLLNSRHCMNLGPTAACDAGWTHVGGRCMKAFSGGSNGDKFNQAENRCEAEGAALASIHSGAEWVTAKSLCRAMSDSSPNCWLGAIDEASDHEWAWVDNFAGETSRIDTVRFGFIGRSFPAWRDSVWEAGTSSWSGSTPRCGYIKNGNFLEDTDCSDRQGFVICQMDQYLDCGVVTPTPSPSSAPTPSSSSLPTPSGTPMATSTPSNTPAPTTSTSGSPAASVTPRPSSSATSSESPSITPATTASTSVTPTSTASRTPSPSTTTTPSASPTAEVTPTPAVTATGTASPTASSSPTPSVTPSSSSTASNTASTTATPTASLTTSATAQSFPQWLWRWNYIDATHLTYSSDQGDLAATEAKMWWGDNCCSPQQGWVPVSTGAAIEDEWFQVTFDTPMHITKVALQGVYGGGRWGKTNSYFVEYRDREGNWVRATRGTNLNEVFNGPSGQSDTVRSIGTLSGNGVHTDAVRIIPRNAGCTNKCVTRLDIFGGPLAIWPTPTPTADPTTTPTTTASVSASVSSLETASPSVTSTRTPSETASNTASETASVTMTPSETASQTASQTASETMTPSQTPSQTASETASTTMTPSTTSSVSPSTTSSVTASITPSQTPSETASSTSTSTPSVTLTPTASVTPSSTVAERLMFVVEDRELQTGGGGGGDTGALSVRVVEVPSVMTVIAGVQSGQPICSDGEAPSLLVSTGTIRLEVQGADLPPSLGLGLYSSTLAPDFLVSALNLTTTLPPALGLSGATSYTFDVDLSLARRSDFVFSAPPSQFGNATVVLDVFDEADGGLNVRRRLKLGIPLVSFADLADACGSQGVGAVAPSPSPAPVLPDIPLDAVSGGNQQEEAVFFRLDPNTIQVTSSVGAPTVEERMQIESTSANATWFDMMVERATVTVTASSTGPDADHAVAAIHAHVNTAYNQVRLSVVTNTAFAVTSVTLGLVVDGATVAAALVTLEVTQLKLTPPTAEVMLEPTQVERVEVIAQTAGPVAYWFMLAPGASSSLPPWLSVEMGTESTAILASPSVPATFRLRIANAQPIWFPEEAGVTEHILQLAAIPYNNVTLSTASEAVWRLTTAPGDALLLEMPVIVTVLVGTLSAPNSVVSTDVPAAVEAVDGVIMLPTDNITFTAPWSERPVAELSSSIGGTVLPYRRAQVRNRDDFVMTLDPRDQFARGPSDAPPALLNLTFISSEGTAFTDVLNSGTISSSSPFRLEVVGCGLGSGQIERPPPALGSYQLLLTAQQLGVATVVWSSGNVVLPGFPLEVEVLPVLCREEEAEVPDVRGTECLCKPGYYRTAAGTCGPCGVGKYKGEPSNSGVDSCRRCGVNRFAYLGASSCEVCPKNVECDGGILTLPDAVWCESCLDGKNATDGLVGDVRDADAGSTGMVPAVMSTTDVIVCVNAEACLAGEEGVMVGCAELHDPDSVLCSRCIPGAASPSAAANCTSCPNQVVSITIFALGILIFAGLIGFLVRKRIKKETERMYDGMTGGSAKGVGPLKKRASSRMSLLPSSKKQQASFFNSTRARKLQEAEQMKEADRRADALGPVLVSGTLRIFTAYMQLGMVVLSSATMSTLMTDVKTARRLHDEASQDDVSLRSVGSGASQGIMTTVKSAFVLLDAILAGGMAALPTWQCIAESTHASTSLTLMCIVLGIAAVGGLSTWYLVRKSAMQASWLKDDRQSAPRTTPVQIACVTAVLLYFFTWFTAAKQAIASLQDLPVEVEGKMRLKIDPEIERGSLTYAVVKGVAVLTLILAGVVIPIGILFVLKSLRKRDPNSTTPAPEHHVAFKFLVEGIRTKKQRGSRHAYSFEVVRMFERTLLAAVVTLVDLRSSQATLIVLILGVGMFLQGVLRPYQMKWLNTVDKIGHLVLLISQALAQLGLESLEDYHESNGEDAGVPFLTGLCLVLIGVLNGVTAVLIICTGLFGASKGSRHIMTSCMKRLHCGFLVPRIQMKAVQLEGVGDRMTQSSMQLLDGGNNAIVRNPMASNPMVAKMVKHRKESTILMGIEEDRAEKDAEKGKKKKKEFEPVRNRDEGTGRGRRESFRANRGRGREESKEGGVGSDDDQGKERGGSSAQLAAMVRTSQRRLSGVSLAFAPRQTRRGSSKGKGKLMKGASGRGGSKGKRKTPNSKGNGRGIVSVQRINPMDVMKAQANGVPKTANAPSPSAANLPASAAARGMRPMRRNRVAVKKGPPSL